MTAADAWFGGMPWARASRYISAQPVGAATGTLFSKLTFGLPAVTPAITPRPGLAMTPPKEPHRRTAGVIFGLIRAGGGRVVAAPDGAYIAAAIMFTASEASANPAVTLARMLSDTWTGISPASVSAFLTGQAAGTVAAIALIGWLYQPRPRESRPARGPDPRHTAPSD